MSGRQGGESPPGPLQPRPLLVIDLGVLHPHGGHAAAQLLHPRVAVLRSVHHRVQLLQVVQQVLAHHPRPLLPLLRHVAVIVLDVSVGRSSSFIVLFIGKSS